MKRLSPKDKTYTMMLNSSLPLETRVDFGETSRHKTGSILKQIGAGKNVLLLGQQSLPENWAEDVRSSIEAEGFKICKHNLPEGEAAKSLSELEACWKLMQENEFTRKDTVLAVGGGAVTDLAGFCASTYLRGVKLVLVPTTLLAQVDAGIGGKTGINLPAGKNLAGSFYFPNSTIVDPEFVSTLSERELKSGLGEIVKYAFIEQTVAENTNYKVGVQSLARTMLDNFKTGFAGDNPFLTPLISICIKMKLAVVLADPYENKLRRCLNLGHTLAHGLEKASDYQISHGEAVSIGTVFAFKLAASKGLISESVVEPALELTELLKLPQDIPDDLSRAQVAQLTAFDKKRQGSTIKYVLPEKEVGRVNLDTDIEVTELAEFIKNYA